MKQLDYIWEIWVVQLDGALPKAIGYKLKMLIVKNLSINLLPHFVYIKIKWKFILNPYLHEEIMWKLLKMFDIVGCTKYIFREVLKLF